MSRKSGLWTRREFSAGFAGILGAPLFGLGQVRNIFRGSNGPYNGFAYVGSASVNSQGKINVFSTKTVPWKCLQTIEAASPGHFERHPSMPVLYGVHSVSLWANLPRGAVSAYSVEPSIGHLRLLNTQPLSLSATAPRHAAVSHDGTHLIVAAEQGGSYNLLPIAQDGSLLAPTGIRKELGLAENFLAKAARPQCVIIHPNSKIILAADTGNESIHLFTLEDGELRLRHRLRVHTGAGPSQLALSQNGDWLYAANSVDGSLTVHQVNSHTCRVSDTCLYIPNNTLGPKLMAMHPSGRFLAMVSRNSSAPGLAIFCIDTMDGRLAVVEDVARPKAYSAITFSANGQHFIGIDSRTGQIEQSAFNIDSGTISDSNVVGELNAPTCLSLCSA